MTSQTRQKGFVYLWVLFALAVTLTLLSVQIEVTSHQVEKSRQRELRWVLAQYQSAILSYRQSTLGTSDYRLESLERLVRDERDGIVRRHIRKLYPNPITGRLDWVIVRGQDGQVVRIETPDSLK